MPEKKKRTAAEIAAGVETISARTGWPEEKCKQFLHSPSIIYRQAQIPAYHLPEVLAELLEYGMPLGTATITFAVPAEWSEDFRAAAEKAMPGKVREEKPPTAILN